MLARSVARALEDGDLAALPLARPASVLWGRVVARSLAKQLALPAGVAVVAIGGSTLGGSGKTPLALACARELARRGHSVALVGHAYRAAPRVARVVLADDAVETVGDEALLCARALVGLPEARVVVASERQAAVDLAAELARVLVLDGVLQTSPRRATLSLLALDAAEPWGRACATPPRGDLRAPIDALLRTCDAPTYVGDFGYDLDGRGFTARVESDGARLRDGEHLGWPELATLRVGVATALARPGRLLRFLERRGITPVRTLTFADHQPPRALPSLPGIDLWLVSQKCGVALAGGGFAELDYRLELSGELRARLNAEVTRRLLP